MKLPRLPVRPAVAAVLFVAGTAVYAQSAPPPLPPPPLPPPPTAADAPKLEPLPEIPPPPGLAGDPELEPQVTIVRRDSETVEEARVNGRLVWVKVTPRHGRPYFLVPDNSGNVFIRRDSLDAGLRVPLWLLLEF